MPTGWLPPVTHTPHTLLWSSTHPGRGCVLHTTRLAASSIVAAALLAAAGVNRLSQPGNPALVDVVPACQPKTALISPQLVPNRGYLQALCWGGDASSVLAGSHSVCARVLANCVHACMRVCVCAMNE